MKRTPEPEVRPSAAFAKIIDHAVSAGACRMAAKAQPKFAPTWNAVAEAKSADAREGLKRWISRHVR